MSAQANLVNEIIVERHSECPVTTAIAIIAGKWKPTILCEIRECSRRFSDLRRETLPAWATLEHFDHFYRLAVNTRVAGSESGKMLRVGDPIILL